jgi:hypothetical protein
MLLANATPCRQPASGPVPAPKDRESWTPDPVTLQGGRENQRPRPNDAMVPLEAVFCPCCGAALLHSLVLQQNLPQWRGRWRLGQVPKALDQVGDSADSEPPSKRSPT